MKGKNRNYMRKRGQTQGIAVLLLTGLVVFGGAFYTSEKIIIEHRYVGDSSSHLYYDLKTCETKHIDKILSLIHI